jgi:UDP-3-O-[3-hydroxymyristoyl] N-acetylglucosamine deacetylase/3-hydroxyacyl-[acyl-carrier-protein] dehydratase
LHYQTKQQVNIVGDLALIGTRIQEKVIAKPGHFVNTQFAKKMAKIIKIEQRNYVPVYDLHLEPLMDIHKIMAVLPHRPPFFMIDRIIEMSESHVVGMKNVP